MDPKRFDTLTKSLSTSGTRRGALGGCSRAPSACSVSSMWPQKNAVTPPPRGHAAMAAPKPMPARRTRSAARASVTSGRAAVVAKSSVRAAPRIAIAAPVPASRWRAGAGAARQFHRAAPRRPVPRRASRAGPSRTGAGAPSVAVATGHAVERPTPGRGARAGRAWRPRQRLLTARGAAASWEITPQSPSAGSRPPARPAPPVGAGVSVAEATGRTALGSIASRTSSSVRVVLGIHALVARCVAAPSTPSVWRSAPPRA